jgi:serine phosphatase RsbU (regulator of sigma subunit)
MVSNGRLDPEAIIDAVFAALERFSAGRPYDDDCTIVVMKATA